MKLRDPETAEYVYGNTRLRARKAALLSARDYEGLIGLDLEGLLGALAGTAYRPDVEAALPRFHGVRRLHEAVRSNLARSLRELREFYLGVAREVVDLMLSSWDVRNLVTLLRGQAAGAPAEEVLPLIVPVGRLDEASAREIARQAEFVAAVELLLAWRLPTPEDADVLAAAWPEYERTADLASLEHAVVSAHSARVTAALERFGAGAERLVVALREEADDADLLNALRLRAAALVSAGPQTGAPARPPGRSQAADVVLGTLGVTPGEVAAAILALPRTERWRQPLEQWVQTEDLVGLQEQLERARVKSRTRLFLSGNPLGIDLPLAFATAKETEARNLRVLGAGAVDGSDMHVVRARLLLP